MTKNRPDPFQRIFYQELLKKENKRPNIKDQTKDAVSNNQTEFTLEELSQYDGSGGNPSYVAVDGIVYDVSTVAAWGGGTHFSLYAGTDLTAAFNGCHVSEILSDLPQVGFLKEVGS